MTFYWRGFLQLKELERFYEKAPDKIRGHALEFIGRSLMNEEEKIPTNILCRLQALWEWRVNVAGTVIPSESHSTEFATFGRWFASAKFDDDWAIRQLKEAINLAGKVESTHLVVKRLSAFDHTMLRPSLECLQLILETDKDGWGVHLWKDDARPLLDKALRSTNDTVRQAALTIVHRLGKLGFLEFRDLLTKPPS